MIGPAEGTADCGFGRFRDRTVMVTGAAAGIGRAHALAFAGEGAHLICVDRDAAGLEATVAMITGRGGSAAGYAVDVSDDAAVESLRAQLEARGLDVLINNAAVVTGRVHELEALSKSEWHHILDVNTLAPLLIAQAMRPLLKRSGGCVINQVSTAAYVANSAYSVSKAALIALTHAMARRFAEDEIRVNAIAPGLIDTVNVSSFLGEQGRSVFLNEQLVRRPGMPVDVANVALFLASREAGFINGQILSCDGGHLLRL